MERIAAIRQAITHRQRWIFITGGAILITGAVIAGANYLLIGRYGKYIIEWQNVSVEDPMVGVVLGGGIENGKPRPLLQDRLDTAAKLLRAGKVRKLVVSGDNRFASYNEPLVMKNYLMHKKGIDADDIQLDNAGRSTYETCERAQKIFSLDRALFISEATHLPRVLYTCRSFGIEAYGYSSDGQSAGGLQVGQRWREVLARTKASLNIYLIGEQTILGEKIDL